MPSTYCYGVHVSWMHVQQQEVKEVSTCQEFEFGAVEEPRGGKWGGGSCPVFSLLVSPLDLFLSVSLFFSLSLSFSPHFQIRTLYLSSIQVDSIYRCSHCDVPVYWIHRYTEQLLTWGSSTRRLVHFKSFHSSFFLLKLAPSPPLIMNAHVFTPLFAVWMPTAIVDSSVSLVVKARMMPHDPHIYSDCNHNGTLHTYELLTPNGYVWLGRLDTKPPSIWKLFFLAPVLIVIDAGRRLTHVKWTELWAGGC